LIFIRYANPQRRSFIQKKNVEGRVIYVPRRIKGLFAHLVAHIALLIVSPLSYAKTFLFVLRRKNKRLIEGFLKSAYLARLIKKSSAQHIHAHFTTTPASVAMFISKLSNLPLSFTPHNVPIGSNVSVLKEIEHHASAVTAPSYYSRRYWHDLMGVGIHKMYTESLRLVGDKLS